MNFKADLTNCDREPIHIPGKIQAHGCLIAFDIASRIITHASENVQSHFQLSSSEILGNSFDDFLIKATFDLSSANISGLISSAASSGAETENSIVLNISGGQSFYLVLHTSGTSMLAEFEPVEDNASANVQKIMESMLTRILSARSLSETLAFSAEQVKEIIGYDRVMIYRFAENGNGEVVAEAVNEDLEAFYGLHYPASDIPKQARELYKRNLVRIIANVDATDSMIEAKDELTSEIPLDLTDSVLRAVSPIHIQYLKNMGVKASFSVSLISDGELWGLIACHNYSPSLIDYKKRNSCKLIGQLLSTSVVFREGEENKEQKSVFNDHMLDIIKIVRKEWEIPASLLNFEPNILDINEATGAAVLFEDSIYTIGQTPTREQLSALVHWVKNYTKNQVYQTNQLSVEFVEALEYKDVASGLMSCALSREMNEYIFWFKKEMPQEINWAGNPDKPTEQDENGLMSLSPRRSFSVWTQEVQGVSAPWNSNEIGTAMKLREELVHIINERANQIRKLNEQLKQAYDELDTFSFTISHDLKTPLSSIKNYAELLLEMEEDIAVPARSMLQKIVKGADKMNLLIKEVLSYSRIGRQMMQIEEIDMKEMLEDITSELTMVYKNVSPEVEIKNAPVIFGDKIMMYQVFSNIIGNAVKYSSQHAKPVVTIDATVEPNETTYIITDNGIGIDMKYGDQIFDLFRRMNNVGSYEGTGVGLAIVKRILEKHKARVWYESEPGHGTIFYICIKNEENGK